MSGFYDIQQCYTWTAFKASSKILQRTGRALLRYVQPPTRVLRLAKQCTKCEWMIRERVESKERSSGIRGVRCGCSDGTGLHRTQATGEVLAPLFCGDRTVGRWPYGLTTPNTPQRVPSENFIHQCWHLQTNGNYIHEYNTLPCDRVYMYLCLCVNRAVSLPRRLCENLKWEKQFTLSLFNKMTNSFTDHKQYVEKSNRLTWVLGKIVFISKISIFNILKIIFVMHFPEIFILNGTRVVVVECGHLHARCISSIASSIYEIVIFALC